MANDQILINDYTGSFSLNKDDILNLNGKVEDLNFNIKDVEVNLK